MHLTPIPRFRLFTFTALELAVPIKFQNASHDNCKSQFHHKESHYNTQSMLSNSDFVSTPADLCVTTTAPWTKRFSLTQIAYLAVISYLD